MIHQCSVNYWEKDNKYVCQLHKKSNNVAIKFSISFYCVHMTINGAPLYALIQDIDKEISKIILILF